jgi:hypothetical protein
LRGCGRRAECLLGLSAALSSHLHGGMVGYFFVNCLSNVRLSGVGCSRSNYQAATLVGSQL